MDRMLITGGRRVEDGWPLFDPWDHAAFTWLHQDCRDSFRGHEHEPFDYVFHLAAVVGGRLTIERNPLAVAQDLSIDADMCHWATKACPGKVVSFSSTRCGGRGDSHATSSTSMTASGVC